MVLTPSSLLRAATFDAGVLGIHSAALERVGVVGVWGIDVDEVVMMIK